MVPPPGEAWRVVVDRVRKVAGEVFWRKGHIERDWRRRASMMALFATVNWCLGYGEFRGWRTEAWEKVKSSGRAVEDVCNRNAGIADAKFGGFGCSDASGGDAATTADQQSATNPQRADRHSIAPVRGL